MKKIIFVFLITSILMIGCAKEDTIPTLPEPKKPVETAECKTDSDCQVSGCNGEICAKETMMSICLYKPEFGCYESINCKCINEKCGWEKTEEFKECVRKNR